MTRVSHFVLLVAATLLASCDVISADVDQSKLSMVTSPDVAGLSVDAVDATKENRHLRIHYDEDEDDEEDEEERGKGVNLFQKSKLDQMMSGVKEFKRYKNLKAYGYTPSSLQDKLKELYGKKYQDLWERYRANYYDI